MTAELRAGLARLRDAGALYLTVLSGYGAACDRAREQVCPTPGGA
jgi:hypothetical protein